MNRPGCTCAAPIDIAGGCAYCRKCGQEYVLAGITGRVNEDDTVEVSIRLAPPPDEQKPETD